MPSSPVPSPVPAGTGEALFRSGFLTGWVEALRFALSSVENMAPEDRAFLSVSADAVEAEAAAVVSSSPATPGCYICQPGNPDAAEEGCDDCDRASDAYHAALNAPSPASPAETREGLALATPLGWTAAAQRAIDYESGRWCGECRWGEVDDPACCYAGPDAASPAVSLPGERPDAEQVERVAEKAWEQLREAWARIEVALALCDQAVEAYYLPSRADTSVRAVVLKIRAALAAPSLPGEQPGGEET